ncbi:MAG: hypothetical protein K0R57_3671 [Paenibacillaceae bacterium]|jgi:hypothetical protein|nr:hypothetical protein [Paenibacillaceae bacterium]
MPTQLFLSSVSKGLEEIRLQVGSFLNSLGHEAVLFEYTAFAKNQDKQMVHTCLKAVGDCQIYILLIGHEVGYVVAEAEKSITHLELRKAIACNKTVYVFVDQYIKDIYLREYLRIFRSLREQEPHVSHGTLPSTDEVLARLGSISIPRKVFEILNDAYQVVPWIFGFKSAEDIIQTLRSELSASLKAYIDLKNKKQIHSINDVIVAADRFRQNNLFLESFFPLVSEITISDYNEVLRKVQSHLKGGTIYYDEGYDIVSELVTLGNSNGSSLYRFDGGSKLNLIGRSGLASGRHDPIGLNDPELFAAVTFKDALAGSQPGIKLQSSEIFITDEQIYLCHVFGDYVFTVHFPIEELHVEGAFMEEQADVLYKGLLSLKANSDIIKLFSFCL